MRGQASLEVFFAFTLFFLLMAWLANYVEAFNSSVLSSSLIQEQIIARNLAVLANRVCTSNSSITYSLPCVIRGNQSLFYGINSSGNAVNVYAPDIGTNWSAPALCTLNTSFLSETAEPYKLRFVACDPSDAVPAKLCIARQSDGKVVFSRGDCIQ